LIGGGTNGALLNVDAALVAAAAKPRTDGCAIRAAAITKNPKTTTTTTTTTKRIDFYDNNNL
jgi:hypothetical protein